MKPPSIISKDIKEERASGTIWITSSWVIRITKQMITPMQLISSIKSLLKKTLFHKTLITIWRNVI